MGALLCLRPRSFTLFPPSRPVVRNREAHAEDGRPSYSVSRLPFPFPRASKWAEVASEGTEARAITRSLPLCRRVVGGGATVRARRIGEP